MFGDVAERLILPRHWLAMWRLARAPKADRKSSHDAELKFCADVLPGDFLNYGFYSDPELSPREISLQKISEAQVAYGRLILSHVRDRSRPVLDAGCGMGGLVNLLVADGFNVIPLTPNQAQARHIRGKYPNISIIERRVEPQALADFNGKFGTVITSESFQYMKLVPGMQTLARALAPGGRWVLCDYFRIAQTRRRSGHQWTEFNEALRQNGWKVVYERDITTNVLPTLRYLHMLGGTVGNAAADFAIGKLRRKRPVLHYLFEVVLRNWRDYITDQVRTVDPDVFVREKKYMLMVMERA